jgi:hypothetical protein
MLRQFCLGRGSALLCLAKPVREVTAAAGPRSREPDELGLSSLIAAGGWPVGILILFGVLIMLGNVAEIFPSLRSSSSGPTVPFAQSAARTRHEFPPPEPGFWPKFNRVWTRRRVSATPTGVENTQMEQRQTSAAPTSQIRGAWFRAVALAYRQKRPRS